MKRYLNFSNVAPYLLLLVLWTIAYWIINNPILIPSPTQAVGALINYTHDPRFYISLSSTLTNLVNSWLIVQALLLLTLIVVKSHDIAKNIVEKWSTMFQTMPTFAMLPILIVALGLGKSTLYALIIFSNFWVGVGYLLTAVNLTQSHWQPQLTNLRWSIFKQIRHVYVYAMLPHLLSISGITWGLCWRTLLAVEVMFGGLASQLGLGVLMMEERVSYNSAEVWALLLVVMLISISIGQVFNFLKSKIHWQ